MEGDLSRHFGASVTDRLLASRSPEERLRGIQRLAAEGSSQALDRLVRALEPGAVLSKDLRVRIEVVRALRFHLDQDGPRQVVVRALLDGATLASGSRDAELASLLRDTAAISLSRYGGVQGAEVLVGLLRQGGVVASAASNALVARPPEQFSTLIGAQPPGSVEVIHLLMSLGDLRAIPSLRSSVRMGEPDVRAMSLVALATLGDGEAPLIARQWVKDSDPLPKMAAIRALLLTSPAEGRAALAPLLRESSSRDTALRLALDGPGTELVKELSELCLDRSVSIEQRSLAIQALGRVGDEDAVKTLELLLPSPQGREAALALALAPGDPARKALERALTGERKVLALRAAVVRALVLRDAPSGLLDAADAIWKSNTSRETSVFAWVALGKRLPTDKDFQSPTLLGAAARGALAIGPKALASLLDELEREPGGERVHREVLALGLLAKPDGGRLSTQVLIGWVDEGGAAAPLAARALAVRDDEVTLERVARLLQGGAPQLRVHTALGLGRSPRPDAVGRLVDAYRYEVDARVRRAIVRALSWRSEPRRMEVLKLAAEVDPEEMVRRLARLAVQGQKIPEQVSGDLVGWLQVEGGQGAAMLRWERPDGLVLPVMTEEDGALLVPGLSSAPSHVDLAL